ncbi:hypothetical protein [Alienimonas sp. DA493]|uniref:hypothetical protein n=1 Tax=Alienimonas sp. DA493 TaxID=3373605 RepID=UPI003754FFAE
MNSSADPSADSGGLAAKVDRVRSTAKRELASLRRYWRDADGIWLTVPRLQDPEVLAAISRHLLNAGGSQTLLNSAISASTVDILERAAKRSEGYRLNELPSFVVQQAVSILDGFLLNLSRVWLTAHPRALLRSGRGQKTREVSLAEVLDAPSRDVLINRVVEREVRRRAYGSLAEQLSSLNDLFKYELPPDATETLAELKAARDLLVHAGGVVNADYLAAAGPAARFAAGERIQLPTDYVQNSLDVIFSAVDSIAQAAVAKAGDAPARG